MLIELTIENFYSIKEEITFSMVASNDTTHKNNYIKDSGKNLKVLKTTAIYGANSSGKTTVLSAFAFIQYFLKKSNTMQKGNKIAVEPFKLDKEYQNKPSIFKIIFKAEDIKYVYGFSTNTTEITEEYLYYYPNGRQTLIFERKNVNEYKFTNDVETQKQIKDKFHADNKLFIATLSTWDYEKAQIPYNWLCNEIKILEAEGSRENFTSELINGDNEKMKKLSEHFCNIIDDIESINVEEIEIDEEELPLFKFLNDEAKKKIIEGGKNKLYNVTTRHKMVNGEGYVDFDLANESDGTQKLYGLLGVWLDVLEHGRTLIVDELDVRLHPHLTKYLIELFHDPNMNKNHGQLIFSTHDTILLDQDLFRRDQIWFTEKTKENSTDLYSLDDFSVRKDAVILKGYHQGKYGAIPHIKGDIIW